MQVGKYRNEHPHVSEMRVRVNRKLWPQITKEEVEAIALQALDGLPVPEGIEVRSFRYGQTEAVSDGLSMLSRGEFQFIQPAQGFGVSVKKPKKGKASLYTMTPSLNHRKKVPIDPSLLQMR